MSDAESDPELTQLLTDLTRTLRELEREVEREPQRGPRLPTPSELSRFTSEVAIPGLILLLRTNVRALQLLQRAIRLADGREPTPDSAVSGARARAEEVGRASLSQLDSVLAELQSALEARPENEEADELLSRARDLRAEVRDELAGEEHSMATDGREPGSEESDAVAIDIESELQSLKDNLDDAADGGDSEPGAGPDGTDGDDSGAGGEG